MIRRIQCAVALLVLALLALPTLPAAAEPGRRISCPSARQLAEVTGLPVVSLTATPTTCRYDGGVAFSYVEHPAPGDPTAHHWEVGPGLTGRLTGLPDQATAAAAAPLFRPQMEVYTVPGEHTVGGRQWRTTCEPYSATTRCRTEIWAHTIVVDGDTFRRRTGWSFNSLTYLWAERSLWGQNPLATPGVWRSDGRLWRTECDAPATGWGTCRSWLWQPTVRVVDGEPSASYGWVLNNQVLFT